MTEREKVLTEAMGIVTADRNKQYGEPEDNFSTIALLWSVFLDKDISSADVATMMCLFKIARLKNSHYQSVDSIVDLCGYGACLAECLEGLHG